MSRTLWLVLVALCATNSAVAQEKTNLRRDQPTRIAPPADSLGSVTPTTEMWFYEQEIKRHDDPKQAVRRRAEARAQERHDRLVSLRWYGIDNSRPVVSCPWSGGYSAYMGSNTYDPQRFRPVVAPVILYRGDEK